jgi:hypothetical protein
LRRLRRGDRRVCAEPGDAEPRDAKPTDATSLLSKHAAPVAQILQGGVRFGDIVALHTWVWGDIGYNRAAYGMYQQEAQLDSHEYNRHNRLDFVLHMDFYVD